MRKPTVFKVLAGAILALVLGQTMAFGKSFVVCLPVEARLVYADGSAAAGVKVTRDWSWDARSGSDSAVTDDAGRFAFDQVDVSVGLSRLLPQEVVIKQSFNAHIDAGANEILYMSNANYDAADARPMKFECVADETASDNGFFWSTCKPVE